MKALITTVFTLIMTSSLYSQNQALPYHQIPKAPATYTAGAVVSRMLDGLGFRYYWATQGLRAQDLAYKPSAEARTSEETLDHILGLTQVILHSALKKPNTGNNFGDLNFEQKRKKTLLNIQQASAIFLYSDKLSDFTMVFERGEKTTEFPFWNQINGPISDALWHVGQIVSFRRSSGNPFPKGVSILQGVKRIK